MDIKVIVGIIIASIFLLAVAVPVSVTVLDGVINPTLVTNETVTSTNDTMITLAHTPVDYSRAQPILTNATGEYTLPTANYTLYTLSSANSSYNGSIYFNDVDWTTYGNTTLVTYYYQQEGFDASTIDQTVLKFIPLAFVVMLLVVVFLSIAV